MQAFRHGRPHNKYPVLEGSERRGSGSEKALQAMQIYSHLGIILTHAYIRGDCVQYHLQLLLLSIIASAWIA